MKNIKIKYFGQLPKTIEGFWNDCERSCIGSIHLTSRCIKDITEDEWKYIQKKYSYLTIRKIDEPKKKEKIKEEIKEEIKEDEFLKKPNKKLKITKKKTSMF